MVWHGTMAIYPERLPPLIWEWRIMVHDGTRCPWSRILWFFSLPLTQSWTVQGVKKRCLSPHGQATKTWFTETSQEELSIPFILIKEGVNWWTNNENGKIIKSAVMRHLLMLCKDITSHTVKQELIYSTIKWSTHSTLSGVHDNIIWCN